MTQQESTTATGTATPTNARMIDRIQRAARRPEPFEPSESPFWDDTHIAGQLLLAHLDDTHDAASRPIGSIRRSVDLLLGLGLAGPGRRVLDLGCGPGLYAQMLARAGCTVTGIDISRSSLEHARARAEDAGLTISYRLQDFLTIDEPGCYDLVLQAYGELSTFAPAVRDDLLRRMRTSLAPGGAIVFDVSTPFAHPRPPAPQRWKLEVDGLWRTGAHLVLDERFEYPDHLCCDQYVVVDDDVVTYRMWFQDYTPVTLTAWLTGAGLTVEHLWGSLTGDPVEHDSPFLAVVARPGRTPVPVGGQPTGEDSP